jgi:hypothetical protein
MFPMAPAMIREKLSTNPKGTFFFHKVDKYHPSAPTATILKILRMYLPKLVPSSNPNAIPLFSTKWIINQFLAMMNSSPSIIWVLTQIFKIWSARRIIKMIRSDLYLTFISNILLLKIRVYPIHPDLKTFLPLPAIN